MIPKRIHYCWFGGKKIPKLAKKCIASWKKFCPNYEIIEWNENNFDMNYCDYVKEAYRAKKYAFVTDVVRLYALVNYGGIYMDTDVEIIKSLDVFLQYNAFSGFESINFVPTGIMACEKGHKLFKEFLKEYDNIHFIKSDNKYDLTTNCVRITNICKKYGLNLNNKKQIIQKFVLYPSEYFCPKDWVTKKINITKNSYTIHHFNGSYLSFYNRLKLFIISSIGKNIKYIFKIKKFLKI